MNNKKKLSVLAIAAVATSLFTLAPVASYAADMDAAAAQVKCMKDNVTSMVNTEKDCTDTGGAVVKDDANQSTSTTTTNTTNTTTSTSTVGTDAKSMPNDNSGMQQNNGAASSSQPAATVEPDTTRQSAPTDTTR